MLPFQLRPITDADLDALVSLDCDPEVMRFISGGQPTPRAHYAEALLPRMLAAATWPGLGFFTVESPTLAFMGWAHLRLDSFDTAWAEIGYRLARPYWGLGVASAASRLLVRRAFDVLDFEVVSARTMPENLASHRVMEKVGLRETGRLAVAAPTQEEGTEPAAQAEPVVVPPAEAAWPEVVSAALAQATPAASPEPVALTGADLAR